MPANRYWERIAKAIAAFAGRGDRLECTEVWRSEELTECELCGHAPIACLHRLKNLRTGRSLVVGSRCIVNYKRVLGKWGWPFDLGVGQDLQWWADRMNAREPGLVGALAGPEGGAVDAEAVEDAYRMNALVDARLSESDMEDLANAYDEDDEELGEDDDYDPDEEAPEGLRRDEVDWDSM